MPTCQNVRRTAGHLQICAVCDASLRVIRLVHVWVNIGDKCLWVHRNDGRGRGRAASQAHMPVGGCGKLLMARASLERSGSPISAHECSDAEQDRVSLIQGVCPGCIVSMRADHSKFKWPCQALGTKLPWSDQDIPSLSNGIHTDRNDQFVTKKRTVRYQACNPFPILHTAEAATQAGRQVEPFCFSSLDDSIIVIEKNTSQALERSSSIPAAVDQKATGRVRSD